ncbi:inner membrane protein [Legionella busanensis]|uniref:Inner membrane protein n=2 Tax=Legionella busanensis TaxID=190655 RepID=A0A378JIU2_9GAMM|nr:inner membrane protein [Legionella busanensis]
MSTEIMPFMNAVGERVMSQNQIINIKDKAGSSSVICEYAGGHFKLTEKGISFLGKDKDGNPMAPRWICSPLYVIAKTRDAKSGEWGRLLEWQDDDGIIHQWAMPLSLLQGDSSEVRRELANLGLSISPNKIARDLLATYLQVFPVEARARCVDKLGWHGETFITASQAIGNSSERIVFQNTNAIESALSVSGSVKDWQDTIGALSAGNSRLVFAISAALAPTLATIAGEDSGGFHLRGASSCGKSTALKVAASVWGNPQSYCRLWRSTANGLEGLAALHNDGLLILDELSQMDPKEAGEAAYLLANGQGKTRATRQGIAKPASRWSLFFLSAGEESLISLMARIGQRTNVGQEIRLADIEADAGFNMGIFENIHNQLSPATMALSLKEYSGKYYGAVGLEWLKKVVANRQAIASKINGLIQEFINKLAIANATGQIIRVARRFALVAIAGELASHYGLTSWEKGESFSAAQKCFNVWLDAFGSEGNREDRAILAQVRAFFESHGASRFDNVRTPNNERVLNRAGFYSTDDEGYRVYMVLTEVFKKELCQGFEPKMVVRVLMNEGWLKPGVDGSPTHKPRIRGVGTPRVYKFTDKIWGGE